MSFWTDIRDTLEAPFKAVGDFFVNVAEGKNVLESIGQTGVGVIAGTTGLDAVVQKYTHLDVVGEKLSPYTLGITGRIVSQNEKKLSVNTGSEPITKDWSTNYFSGEGKQGAIVLATYLGGPSGGAAAAGAVQKLDKGGFNFGSFGSSLASVGSNLAGAGDLGDFGDYVNQAKGYVDEAEGIYGLFKQNTPPTQKGYTNTTSGIGGSGFSGFNQSVVDGAGKALLIIGVMLAASYFLAKKSHG